MRKALTTNFITTEKAFALDYIKIAGRDAPEAMSLYRKLKELGTLKKCHYAVRMEAYLPNGLVAKNEHVQILSTPGSDTNILWLLITQAEWPLLQADTDSTKIGNQQSNRITGRQAGEISLTFLEAGQAQILNSLQAIENCIFNGNGTQNPPAQYAIKMTPYLFDSRDFSVALYGRQFLAGLQSVQLSTSASDKDPVEVSTTWIQLDPFMRR